MCWSVCLRSTWPLCMLSPYVQYALSVSAVGYFFPFLFVFGIQSTWLIYYDINIKQIETLKKQRLGLEGFFFFTSPYFIWTQTVLNSFFFLLLLNFFCTSLLLPTKFLLPVSIFKKQTCCKKSMGSCNLIVHVNDIHPLWSLPGSRKQRVQHDDEQD